MDTRTIAIIGLGYVGLPLAVEFGRLRRVIGFDIKQARVEELRSGCDHTLECDADELKRASMLFFTDDPSLLSEAGFFIVTVPTPVDRAKRPDLRPLEAACQTVGSVLQRGAIVVFESTVYPGATEAVCVPILERVSGLKFNSDFYCGYSPERINPGDKNHRLTNIVKITSGSTPEAARIIDETYREIISAGTHLASSIQVAEAAKVIENTQRDVNIALMNELSLIFKKMGIDTNEVLEAAATKWNFLAFRPGLVGGHCIGVDPYYLTHRAQELGHHPEVILAGRRINDRMSAEVADETVRLMVSRRIDVSRGAVLILGLSFKENCPDIRNSRVADIYHRLESYGLIPDVYDPWINVDEAGEEYGIRCLTDWPKRNTYDAIIVAVAHTQFRELGADGIRQFGRDTCVVYDVKSIFDRSTTDSRL